MLVTTQQIAKLIDDYINKGYADRVLKIEWRGQYIRGHVPWNNAEDCYHKWLKIVEFIEWLKDFYPEKAELLKK
ncbi:MAG: hypothetical protein IKA81_00575 [Alistipes sp.]|nr:hypothetical protein [Alistipes sp.]